VQATPAELPQTARSTGPILPPMTPPAPSWKQELRHEPPPAGPKPEEQK
jgi:hypothetical protein